MDNYLRNMLFASECLQFLFGEVNIPWEMPVTPILKASLLTEFDKEIYVAVYTIWDTFSSDIHDCYRELIDDDKNVTENQENEEYEKSTGFAKAYRFSKYAVSAADAYFSKGYTPGSFLGYCAIILGVATYYFSFPSNQVPETAVEVVALVLLAHQLTGQFYKHHGWKGIRDISLKFNHATRMLRNS